MKASALGQPLDQMIDAADITPTVIKVYSLIALHCATLASIYRYENIQLLPCSGRPVSGDCEPPRKEAASARAASSPRRVEEFFAG
jgi:hypothetical protein